MVRFRRFDLFWLLACGILSAAWCLTAARELSPTFDEPIYLRAGLGRWRTGEFAGLKAGGIMPLPVDVCTLPLNVLEWRRGTPIDVDSEIESILPMARAANLLFWWLLLVYALRIGRDLGGPWAGRLAVLFLACEPNCLAHATLATTDIALTATLLLLAFHYRANRSQGWPRRIVVPALCYAAAVLAKASAIVFGPLCLFVLEVDFQLRAGEQGMLQRSVRASLQLLAVTGLGFFLASIYCGGDSGSAHADFARAVHALPPPFGRDALASLPIYSQAWDAIRFQIAHNRTGHGGVFLLGKWHAEGSLWYYYPTALSIKAPTPLLVVTALVFLLRPRSLLSWAAAAAGLMLLVSLTCRIQIGIRYFLPLLALANIAAAAGLARTLASLQAPAWRRAAALGSAGVCACAVACAASIWPDGLRYTNAVWGGPKRGYLLLSDSNYDWGQGLKALAQWQRHHRVGTMDVVYFGSDAAVRRPELRVRPLGEISGGEPFANHYLAVSPTVLYGLPESQTPAAHRLQAMKPAARAGPFLIFDLRSVDLHASKQP